MQRFRLIVAACLVILTAIGVPGLAQAGAGFEAPAWPNAQLTMADLTLTVFPGAAYDRQAGTLVTGAEKTLRQPGVKQRAVLPENTPISAVRAMAVRGEGKPYLVTLWTADASVGHPGDTSVILAVFPEGAREPTDVVSVQTDVFCDTDDGKRLDLGPDEGFFIRNHHNNSNQSYLDTGLFHVIDGRLRRVASVFTLDVRLDCSHTFFEKLSWRTSASPSGPRPDVAAAVAISPDPDCPGGKTAVRRQTFAETYRYDPARKQYLPGGKGFAGLDRFNEKNF